ncbi:MAG: HAD family phosphatase [Betaproteobacteria bacterium]|nr:HAD family phosphatase [Betaproteobacteria bacterium]
MPTSDVSDGAEQPAVDALVFDFGNVVVDIDFGRAIAAWARAAGVSAEALAPRFTYDACYQALEVGAIDGATYFAALRRTLGVALSDEQLLEGWNAILGEPLPGIDRLLHALAPELPLYVFSNTNPMHHAWWSAHFRDTLRPFSAVFCSCDLGLRKPAPEAFLRVAERIGRVPARIGFFDDLAENVEGACNAGLAGFRVTSVADMRRVLIEDLGVTVPV